MGLHQRLTPVQVQYLKLLQLPAAQLEERIREELEENPMLEESPQDELPEDTLATSVETSIISSTPTEEQSISTEDTAVTDPRDRDNDYSIEDFMNDELEGFKAPRSKNYDDEDNSQDRGQAVEETLNESLAKQLSLLELSPRMKVLAEEIVGSLDSDGYFRIPLEQIVQDTSIYYGEEYTLPEAERLLKRIQRLDPIGIASRTLQECLLVQLEAMNSTNPAKGMALHILSEHFDLFIKKNYQILAKKLQIKLQDLKPALDLIQHLNPKPGAPSAPVGESRRYITPDFYIEKTPDQKEFIITLNERGVPSIRINGSYKELTKKKHTLAAGERPLPDDAKEFINKKFEAAKAFVLAYYQRRKTLLNVMQAIVSRQNEFFINGEKFLKPMIYKNIAEDISMDISTICRVVNGKYCQCDHGVYELKYFFSEAIMLDTTEDGDEESSSEQVSNKVVKGRIKELISEENPMKPLTDDELAERLRGAGYELARRTVAKYREQMNIPVARMRKRIV
ncbi:MAG TPA: RNA polymerase factor sigma-54 [Candidatus Kapabacteria bacterium]|nr:RNA polymerase factor sigma-54 [Candidatus Kapabacteria bacterium]